MTAQWIPPRTWATGELVTELILNQHIRDNLEWLKTPTAGTDDLTSGDITTTSTSWTDATGLSIGLTTNGGRIELGFSGVVSNSTANQGVNMTFLVNSADV